MKLWNKKEICMADDGCDDRSLQRDDCDGADDL